MVVTGCTAAAAGLASVWIVCGKRRWWVRVLAAPVLVLALAAAQHGLMWASYILKYWLTVTSKPLSDYLLIALRSTPSGVWYWYKTAGLGIATICVWLLLVRAAGWFDPFGDDSAADRVNSVHAQRRQMFARCAALGLFGLVAVFPLMLLYHLMTPSPIPAVKLPVPNGFDDFAAASRMITPADASQLRVWDQLSDATLKVIVLRNGAVFNRAADGLSKSCANPHPYASSTSQAEIDLIPLLSAMSARAAAAERARSNDEYLAACWDLLQVTVLADRGVGANYSIPGQWEGGAALGLWNCREQLPPQECADLAAKLWQLESEREPWSIREARQRIIEENFDWKWHLRAILDDWTAHERHKYERQSYLLRRAELRVIVLDLAIRAFRAEEGKLPDQLSDLVPKYLPAVPDDPFAPGPMKYRLTVAGYTIYSVGPDGDDDGGKPLTPNDVSENGDFGDADLFPSSTRGKVLGTSLNSTTSDNSENEKVENK